MANNNNNNKLLLLTTRLWLGAQGVLARSYGGFRAVENGPGRF